MKDTRPWDEEFCISDNCIGCGVCESVCQFSNIKIQNNKPAFLHYCQRCMACIQYCPQKAIGLKGKPLSVCGEMAGDPLAAAILVGLGIRSLSMSEPNIPRVKYALSGISAAKAAEMAEKARKLRTEAEIRKLAATLAV